MSLVAPLRPAAGLALAWPRALARPLAVMFGALALCWAALVNGQPFFHPDTVSYVRGPDVAVMKLFGPRYATPWATLDPVSISARTGKPAPAARIASSNDDEVLAGRSIYYGALAWLGAITGGFWLTVFVQGLGVAALVDIALRALGARKLSTYAAAMGGLALLTPAPLFVALILPDIWAGIALGAAAALFAFSGRLNRTDTLALAAMVAFAAVAHNSVVLLLAGLFVLGLALHLAVRRALPDLRPTLAVLAAAIALAFAGNALFAAMVEKTAGKPPLMPPFLTGRLVADGPGARYIRERCRGEFVVCRFARTLPSDMDDFLWSAEPGKAVFETAPAKVRRALSDEQLRFALAVVRAYPLQQAAASLKNVALQLGTADLLDFGYRPAMRADLESRIPEPQRTRFQDSLSYAQAWPLTPLWALQMAVTILSLAFAGVFIARRGDRALSDDEKRALLFLAAALAGLVLNGAICGALSALYGRYQARAVWVLPLAAFLLASTSRRSRLEQSRKAV